MKKLLFLTLPLVMVSMIFAQAPMEFYGVTNGGGPDNIGGIFRTDENANVVKVQSFEKYGERTSVNATPIEPVTGFIYGMTSLGGKYDEGVIYEYEIATEGFLIRHSFNSAETGKNPNGSLVKASNGKLYGLTKSGGSNDKGVIFEYDLATHAVQKLYDFTGTDGEAPLGSLMQASDGKLYGMTSAGGASAKGVIFRYDITSGIFEKLMDFNGTDGSAPRGDLLEAANGMMYGFAFTGGANNYGVMFSFDKTTLTYTKLQDLTTVTRYPTGSFIQASSGLLYGISRQRLFKYNTSTSALELITCEGDGTPTEGLYNEIYFTSKIATGYTGEIGTVCKYSTFTGVTVIAHFTQSTIQPNFSAGTHPCNGMLLASDDILYGVSAEDADYHGGALYSFGGSAQSLRGKVMFNIQSTIGKSSSELVEVDKKLYGISSGGRYNDGTIYRYDMLTDSVEVMVNMKIFTGDIPSMNDINMSFVKHPNGKLYAFFPYGGAFGDGFIMEYVPGENTYTTVYSRPSTPGANSVRISMMVAQNGLMYGSTHNGGANGYGVLYSFDVATNTFTTLYNWAAYNESPNNIQPIQAQNGKLYGITSGNVNGVAGFIYSYDIATNTLQELVSFTPLGISGAMGPFVEGFDGNLYASFRHGGSSSYQGTILKFDPVASTAALIFDFTNTVTGTMPGKLTAGTNGKLYGLAQATKLFEFDPVTSAYAIKHTFTSAEAVTFNNYYGLPKICKLIPDTSVLEIAEICEASTFTKTSSVSGPTMTYQWLKDGTDIPGATANTLSMTAAIGDNGYYYCRVDNGCRWIYSDSVALTVLPLPVVQAGADQHICNDSLAVLNASGDAASYTWSNGIIDGEPFVITADGEYILSGVSIDGCVKTDTVGIFVSPEVHAGQDATVCMNSEVTFTASGDAVSYTWSDNVTDGEPFFAAQTHSYVLTGVNAEGCVNTDTVVLTVLPLPTVIAGLDQHICDDSLAVFTAGGDAASYTWNNGVIDGDPFVITGNSEFILTGTNADGCANTDTVNVFLSPEVFAGQDTAVCMASLATLNASGDAMSYTWSDGIMDGEPFFVDQAHSYIVTGVNAEGCVNTDTIEVTLITPPIVVAGIDQHICTDSVAVFSASGDAVSYSWNNGIIDGDPFVITGNGEYILTGESTEGCVNTDTVQVFISPAVYAGQDTSVCLFSPATLNASGDAVNYTWSGGAVNGEPFVADETQTYIVTALDAEGCINTDTLELTVDSCLIVWPGDTDNDFEVGTLDFFNVGLNFGATGEPRNSVTNDWLPQTANFWDSIMNSGSGSGLDQTYADCNGDGTIDFDDTLAVDQNFALFHTLKPVPEEVQNLTETGHIFFTSSSQVYGANKLVTIQIHAGTSDQMMEEVYGLSFDVNYIASGIVPGSLQIQMNNQSWLGEVSTNLIRLGVNDAAANTTHLALCRTNHTNVSDYGAIGRVTFITSGESGTLDLDISNALQIDSAGVPHDLESESYSVAIDPLLTVEDHGKKLDCKVYPNPSKGLFNISGLQPEIVYTVALRDITGKLLLESRITHQFEAQFNAQLSAGTYLVEISDGHAVYREPIVVTNH